jgi:hypothetical protein
VTGSAPTGLLPDLVVRLSAPDSARPGADIGQRIHLGVRNIGRAPAWGTQGHPAGFMVDLTLGRDEVLPVGFKVYSPHYAENVLLEGGRVSRTTDIAPAATQRFPVGAGIPADVPPGPYFLCAYVDPGNVVRESDERNNVSCLPLRILPRGQGEGSRTDEGLHRDRPPEDDPSPHGSGRLHDSAGSDPTGDVVVTGFSPPGCVDRGGTVTIHGKGFGHDQRTRLVELGGHGLGLVVGVTRWTSTKITVVVPDDTRLAGGQWYYLGIQDKHRNWLSNIDRTVTICRPIE